MVKHLGEALEGARISVKYKNIDSVAIHASRLLSMLAYSDIGAGADSAAAYEMGRALLEIDAPLIDRRELSLTRLNEAVDTLAALRPLLKPKLLKACMAAITADGVVTPVEIELARVIADSLDCPMPPVESNQ